MINFCPKDLGPFKVESKLVVCYATKGKETASKLVKQTVEVDL